MSMEGRNPFAQVTPRIYVICLTDAYDIAQNWVLVYYFSTLESQYVFCVESEQ